MKTPEELAIGSSLRRLVQNPYRLLSEVSLTESHVFLDVGCGTGFLSLPASQIVGPDGLVYAVDVSEKYLKTLKQSVERLNISNIKVLQTSAEKLEGVPDKAVDRAFFLFSLHHVDDVKQSFTTLRKKLRDDGLVSVVDPIGSRFFGHGTNPAKVARVLEEVGYRIVRMKKGLVFWRMLASPFNY